MCCGLVAFDLEDFKQTHLHVNFDLGEASHNSKSGFWVICEARI